MLPSDFSKLRVRGKRVFIGPKKLKPIANKKNVGSRIKFHYGDYIIKIDDPAWGWNQSTTELKMWKKISKYDRRYFLALEGGKPRKGKTRGWVAQKFIKFKYFACWCTTELNANKISDKAESAWVAKYFSLVERLISKYNFGRDLEYNWCITEDGKFKIVDWGLVTGINV